MEEMLFNQNWGSGQSVWSIIQFADIYQQTVGVI